LGRWADAAPLRVDAIVTDVFMPELSEMDFYDHLVARMPTPSKLDDLAWWSTPSRWCCFEPRRAQRRPASRIQLQQPALERDLDPPRCRLGP